MRKLMKATVLMGLNSQHAKDKIHGSNQKVNYY
jgi:hypothetical protein